jgi:hypothetical protein
MRSLRDNLGDPTLHLLTTVLVLLYLAFGSRSGSSTSEPETHFAYCVKCHAHYMPGKACDCAHLGNFANARP